MKGKLHQVYLSTVFAPKSRVDLADLSSPVWSCLGINDVDYSITLVLCSPAPAPSRNTQPLALAESSLFPPEKLFNRSLCFCCWQGHIINHNEDFACKTCADGNNLFSDRDPNRAVQSKGYLQTQIEYCTAVQGWSW